MPNGEENKLLLLALLLPLLPASVLFTFIETALLLKVLPPIEAVADGMEKVPAAFGLITYTNETALLDTPLIIEVLLSWLGPLTIIKLFNAGGVICPLLGPFWIVNLSSAYSSLAISEGLTEATNFTCATTLLPVKYISSKIIFRKVVAIMNCKNN
jgi:hypothetical protein